MSHPSRAVSARPRGAAVTSALAMIAFLATLAPIAANASSSADLATTVTNPSSRVFDGSYTTLTITVTNHGPDSTQSVVVSDNWYSFSTFYGVSATAPSGAKCSAPPVGSRATVTCTTASLTPGASMIIRLTLRVEGFHNQLVQDTASAASTTFDPNTANNTASTSVEIG